MTQKMQSFGLDVYVGKGADDWRLVDSLSSVFEIPQDAIIYYESADAPSAPIHPKWALVHVIKDSRIFAFKVDIEMNANFDWVPALKNFAHNLGVFIAYPDEDTEGDEMISILPDRTVGRRDIDPVDYGGV